MTPTLQKPFPVCMIFLLALTTVILASVAALPAASAQSHEAGGAGHQPHAGEADFTRYREQQVAAADGAADDHFGWWVAHDGNTAVVTAPYDDIGANAEQGSVYVFTRSGTAWTFQQKLTASDGAAGDVFGYSAALLNGDTILVGAFGDDVGANVDQGSVYFFTRSGTTWSEGLHLFAADGAAYATFGRAVALSGDTALVGAYGDNTAQGSVYVYIRNGASWSFQQKLAASDGAANDQFGFAVALDGDTALVGAYVDDVAANTNQGSAYVFARSGTTWTEQAHLLAPDGAAGHEFGVSVALDGDTALVGTWGMISGNVRQGSAYAFTRTGTVWNWQQTLTALDGQAGDYLGYAVALDGDTALVGAPWDDVGAHTEQGSNYVFARSGTIWSEQTHFSASNGAASDRFGIAVALSGSVALVGADLVDVGANTHQGMAGFYTALHEVYLPLMQYNAQ